MKSQTNLVAQQTRLSEWAPQIKECQKRPEGMTIEERCQLHDITKANYYWKLRKVRETFLEAADITPAFLELPVTSFIPPDGSAEPKIFAVLKGNNQLTLEITEQTLPAFVNTLLGAMINAQ